jgi:PAS domain S-box-containing protein
MSNEEARFRKMVESSQDWFWEFDENACFTYVGPQIFNLLGYDPSELIGLNAFDLMDPDEAERVHDHFDPVAKKYLPFNNLVNINRHKDGREVVIESSGTPIFDATGQFRGYRGLDRDITVRKQAEEEQRKKEEIYKLLVENQNELVVKLDAEGRFLFVSPTYCKTFGTSEEELLGKHFLPLVHEEDQASTAKAMESLIHPPHTAYLEQRALTVAGWRWLAWSDRAIVDEEGRVEAVVGVGRDITLRKEVTDELRESKEKLQNIFDSSSEWIWEIDLSGRHTYSNQSLLNLLGYGPDEVVGRDYSDFLHEEDSQAVKKLFPKLVAEKRGWNGWVLRWWHRDGSYRFLESNATPIFNSSGEVVGFRGVDRDITERKEMEGNYRRLSSLTSDYVHYCTRTGDSSFRVQWVEGAISSISGYRIKDVLTMGCFLPLVHPDDQQTASDYFLSLVPGDRKSIEFRIVTQKKEIRWVSEKSRCEAGPSDGELILLGAVTDITERKQAEEALFKSREMLVQTQQLARVGSWLLDVSSNQLTWSEETSRIFGVDPQPFAFSYDTFLKAVHPEDRAAVDAAYSTSLRDGRDTYEIGHRIVRQDTGEVRYVYEKCQHERDANGAIIRSIGMVQDVTERKTNEVALLAATQAAEAANRAKGQFLAKMSHEIRTPMTSIIGFGELLEDTALDPKQQKYLAAINSSGNTLSSLIDDVLDLSKVDAGELAIKLEDISLHDFIRKLGSLQEQQAALKDLSLSVSIDTAVPEFLIGDALRIQQVLLNLLGNAIKFTEKGEVGIEVSLVEETDVRVLLDVAVKDTGIGIPTGLLDKIFEPFTQASGVNSQNYGGSGLGLSISQSLAALMGGSLRVESRVGAGSTFHLILPLKRKTGHVAEKTLAGSEVPLWKGLTLSVLLAEDNPVNAQFITTILENLGHKVTHAGNGRVAIDLVKANAFDLVLMDIQMPVMDGVDALSIVRELEQVSGRPLIVIALTAFALIGDQEKYLEMGFDGYLSKPFTTRALVDEMLRVLPNEASLLADI